MGEVLQAATTRQGPFQIVHDADVLSPAVLLHPSLSREDAAFVAFLLKDEHERAASISALLASLSGAAVRVLQVDNPLRSPLTLERILIQVAGTKHELFLEDDAFLIVQAITERQEAETRIILLIDRAQTLHPLVLRSLQAMAPYFAQEGRPTLQVVFVGHPTFLALLADEELAPLRTALGIQDDLYLSENLEVETLQPQGAALTPTLVDASSVQPPKRSGKGCINGQVVPAPKLAVVRLLRAMTLAATELEALPKATSPKPTPPKVASGEAGDFQPGPAGPETSLSKLGHVWWAFGLVSVLGLGNPARAVEVCQYAGMASHRGRAAVQTEVTQAGGLLTVNVLARLNASPWRLWDVQFLAQEVSTWRNGELQSVAVNGRYSVNGRAKRQQWDVFARTPDGLQATRVQARTLRDFQRRHPAFTARWDPAQFGRPWLADYPAAQPERRTDLDLPRAAMPAGTRTPFALAFYWSRWLPAAGGTVPVFLPGWKRDARVDAPVMPVAPGRWRMALRHPALDGAPSWAEVVVSADHRLLRLTFDVHAPAGDGQGWVDGTGCQGTPLP